MKSRLTALIAIAFIAAWSVATAQSQSPPPSGLSPSTPLPPERPLAGSASGLNLKLDDATRRSITTSAPEERPAPSAAGGLPSLGAGSRSFDPPGGYGRAKSDSRAFPKSVDY